MSTLPPSLQRFRGDLRRAIAADLQRIPPHRRARAGPPVPRRGLTGAAVLAGAAIALAISLPGGSRDIIGRAEAALTPMQPGVLQMRILVRSHAGRQLARIDSWQLTVPPFSARGLMVVRGGPVYEQGVGPRGRSVYDRRRDLIRRLPLGTAGGRVTLQDPVEQIRDLLGSGTARLTGRMRIGGRDAYRFRLPGLTYFADARTMRPLRAVGRVTTPDGRHHQSAVARFTVYRLLPATPGNRALASVERSHPGARMSGVAG